MRTSFLLFFSLLSTTAWSQSWSSQQEEIVKTIQGFSATTAPEGAGADAYGEFLADDFSRWTLGSDKMSNKSDWVEGVRSWFDEGWRVSDRQQEYKEITINNSLAFVRRIVTETYLGPKGDTSTSKAALAEIWIKNGQRWVLKRVDIQVL